MRTLNSASFLTVCLAALLFTSCGKGYQVRFSNFYTEKMDSVVVGNNKIVFTGVKPESVTDFKKLSSGDYAILFITQSKKKFNSSISIPKTGTGNRTIQIDAIKQIAVLEQ